MIDDEETGSDITYLMLVEHHELRTRFANLFGMRDDGSSTAQAAAWKVLAEMLEVHAKAEEEILYPVLLQRGGDEATAETVDAIGDHNQIRDAITLAAGVAPGTDPWWDAVAACRKANDEHLAEEEQDVIPDVRTHTDSDLRAELGARWITFHAEHHAAQGISGEDVDPEAYVHDNS